MRSTVMTLHCLDCRRKLIRPLFFVLENDTPNPICHRCVERLWGNDVAVERGGWEKPLSGNTWVIKVRR